MVNVQCIIVIMNQPLSQALKSVPVHILVTYSYNINFKNIL